MAKPFEVYIPLAPQTASRPKWSSRSGGGHFDERYTRWRVEFAKWLNGYLEDTQGALIQYMSHLSDGSWIREDLREDKAQTDENGNPIWHWGRLDERFYGYAVTLVFVLARPKGELKVYPVNTHTADLDNYQKAVIDGLFESGLVQDLKLNDRWIQEVHAQKRYTWYGSDEQSHIELTIQRLEEED